MTEYSWRVGWFERNKRKYRYYKTDYHAIKKHLENGKKYGLFEGGCTLDFRVKGYFSFVPVGGCDHILGLTYGTKFLGKPKEYWQSLLQKIREEIQDSIRETQ